MFLCNMLCTNRRLFQKECSCCWCYYLCVSTHKGYDGRHDATSRSMAHTYSNYSPCGGWSCCMTQPRCPRANIRPAGRATRLSHYGAAWQINGRRMSVGRARATAGKRRALLRRAACAWPPPPRPYGERASRCPRSHAEPTDQRLNSSVVNGREVQAREWRLARPQMASQNKQCPSGSPCRCRTPTCKRSPPAGNGEWCTTR